jgi:hypothetical protein
MSDTLETKADVIRLTKRISAAFPHANLIPEAYSVYAEALEGVPLHILEAVFIQAAQSSEFFPTLHRIRELMTDLVFRTPLAEVAWEEVVEWKLGKREKFSDPLIARVTEMMGGWWHLSRSEHEGVDRGQFLKIYGSMREQARQETAMTPGWKALLSASSPTPLRLVPAPFAKQLEDPASERRHGMENE